MIVDWLVWLEIQSFQLRTIDFNLTCSYLIFPFSHSNLNTNRIYISHTAGVFFPCKKFPPEGSSLGQVPSTLASLGKGNCPLETRFPSGGNFSKGGKRRPCGTIFSVMEMQIPMDLHKFLPSPDSSVGRVPGYRAKCPRFKSRVLLIVITNDFIIFEFSLLKIKFQEIDLKFCLASIAQLIERQTVDPRVPGSNPVSCLKLSQTTLSSLFFLFWNLNFKRLTWISA